VTLQRGARATRDQLRRRSHEASLIAGGNGENRAQRLTVLKSLRDGGGVDGLGHGAAHRTRQYDLVDLFGSQYLDGEGDVVRVLIRGGLE